MEFIPILYVVHSISKYFGCDGAPFRLSPSYPVIVGFFHGKKKPPPKLLLGQLVQELNRLSPTNDDPSCFSRQFTVSLRCVRTDGPMRSYLKRIKGHAGYWSCERCIQEGVRRPHKKKTKKGKSDQDDDTTKTIQYLDLYAPLREDDDFLNYTVSDDCKDEHVLNLNDLSPFLDIPSFPIISGFVIDSMHTLTAGAFGRKLEGIALIQSEGKLRKADLDAVDQRLFVFQGCKPLEFDRHVRSLSKCVRKYKHHELRQILYYLMIPLFADILQDGHFEHILLLQQAMLLLGGFNPNPVSQDDVELARKLLKRYVEIIIEFGYPVRFSDHESIHIPDDVDFFECGVESLSAYVFENFERFFRSMTRSGHLVVEQMRNLLMQRAKYLLPTGPDGLIWTNFEQFKIQASKVKSDQQTTNVLLEFHEGGVGRVKEMRFPQFTLSNEFPDNVCLFKNGSVVVINDMFEFPKDSKVYFISGFKFGQLADCFTTPFLSSRFHIHFASKLSTQLNEWNINNISGKMYAAPYKFSGSKLPSIFDQKEHKTWFVTPIFHTIFV